MTTKKAPAKAAKKPAKAKADKAPEPRRNKLHEAFAALAEGSAGFAYVGRPTRAYLINEDDFLCALMDAGLFPSTLGLDGTRINRITHDGRTGINPSIITIVFRVLDKAPARSRVLTGNALGVGYEARAVQQAVADLADLRPDEEIAWIEVKNDRSRPDRRFILLTASSGSSSGAAGYLGDLDDDLPF